MIYFVNYVLVHNTAPTNRIFSYLNNIPNDTEVTALFYFSQPNALNTIKPKKNVKINVLYDIGFKCNIIKKLFCFLKCILYTRRNLKKGDIVYTYNISLLKYINKKGVEYFGEMTENPEIVIPNYSRFLKTSINGHINLVRQLTGLFVISTQLRDYYINKGINKDIVHIINMTVDCNRFVGIMKQKSSHKYIAYCGSKYSEEKDGVYRLIKSFSIVNRSFPELCLYIIGEPYNEIVRNEILGICKRAGVIKNVILTGLVPSSKIPQLLKNADILVLNRPKTVQNDNGFPTKLGEYLLTKNPVVVTNVGDISLYLSNGKNALISEPDNDEEFADKICYLLNHIEYANKIGEAGYQTAIEYFNAITETKKLLQYMKSGSNN